MAYTVFIYQGDTMESSQSFSSLQDAFSYLGTLDLTTNVDRCVLDDGEKVLFDLRRDEDGNLTPHAG